jgi:hypothetical protein
MTTALSQAAGPSARLGYTHGALKSMIGACALVTSRLLHQLTRPSEVCLPVQRIDLLDGNELRLERNVPTLLCRYGHENWRDDQLGAAIGYCPRSASGRAESDVAEDVRASVFEHQRIVAAAGEWLLFAQLRRLCDVPNRRDADIASSQLCG